MKGLVEYIKVHGRHFTVELAEDVTGGKWPSKEVERQAQGKVYYNVSGSTLGDMVYLIDMFHKYIHHHKRCMSLMLSWVGNFQMRTVPFCIWVSSLLDDEEEFDFTPYI